MNTGDILNFITEHQYSRIAVKTFSKQNLQVLLKKAE